MTRHATKLTGLAVVTFITWFKAEFTNATSIICHKCRATIIGARHKKVLHVFRSRIHELTNVQTQEQKPLVKKNYGF
jgi:hypothetical protein